MTKVLIVEDEPPISNLIRLSLTKNGYACKCVFDGMEAADFLEKERMTQSFWTLCCPSWTALS